MDVSDLRFFGAVARSGSMSRSATELNTVQSNISAHIRKLETEFRTPLFDRMARGVTLTSAGKRLLPYAERLERLLQDAGRAVLDDGIPRGPLELGTLETTAALRLPETMTAFVSAYPAVDLTLRTGTTCELVNNVLHGDVEGAFVCGPVDHAELLCEPVVEEELALLTAPGVSSAEAALRAGAPRIVVLRSGCSYRERLERWLVRQGVGHPKAMEFGTLEAIISCVSAGLGVTMLPRSLVGSVWRDGRVAVHALPPQDAHVTTVFIRRSDLHVSCALATFLSMIRERHQSSLRTAAE